MATGVVREWVDADGSGVIDCDDTPGGCWTHFSHVRVTGYAALMVGSAVHLEWEAADQDGYRFRATAVWPLGSDPVGTYVAASTSSGMSSSLVIRFDDGTVMVDDGRGFELRS